MAEIIYNSIGKNYNTTRTADPYITDRMYELLAAMPGGLYIDIGCGTANYLTALSKRGLNFVGVDPSEVMLQQAKAKKNNAEFIQAKAEQIPLPDTSFDGATAMFTMHHWDDIGKGLSEIKRVLRPGAHLACLSFTPEQLRGYWLHHYFPKMIERSMLTIPSWADMEVLFANAGFSEVTTEPYFVRDDLQDHFLYSNKNRPEQYLIPEIRNNASSFTVFSDPEEIKAGLLSLEADIDSGNIKDIMRDYENDLGDYLFIKAIA